VAAGWRRCRSRARRRRTTRPGARRRARPARPCRGARAALPAATRRGTAAPAAPTPPARPGTCRAAPPQRMGATRLRAHVGRFHACHWGAASGAALAAQTPALGCDGRFKRWCVCICFLRASQFICITGAAPQRAPPQHRSTGACIERAQAQPTTPAASALRRIQGRVGAGSAAGRAACGPAWPPGAPARPAGWPRTCARTRPAPPPTAAASRTTTPARRAREGLGAALAAARGGGCRACGMSAGQHCDRKRAYSACVQPAPPRKRHCPDPTLTLNRPRPRLQLHVQVLLRLGEDADGGLRLAQVVVDADQRLHRRAGRLVVLQLLVVQRLGERVALLSQRAQRPARGRSCKK